MPENEEDYEQEGAITVKKKVKLPKSTTAKIGQAVVNSMRTSTPTVRKSVMNMLLEADVGKETISKIGMGGMVKKNNDA